MIFVLMNIFLISNHLRNNKTKYRIGAEELDKSVKECLKMQKNNFKIMENHYLKEILDLKRALSLAMRELEIKSN